MCMSTEHTLCKIFVLSGHVRFEVCTFTGECAPRQDIPPEERLQQHRECAQRNPTLSWMKARKIGVVKMRNNSRISESKEQSMVKRLNRQKQEAESVRGKQTKQRKASSRRTVKK